jgi:hypothetical protein
LSLFVVALTKKYFFGKNWYKNEKVSIVNYK